MDYQEKILKELTERYYKSKKDSRQNIITRRTAIQPEKHLYPKYNQNDGSIKEIQAINSAVEKLVVCGFVTCQRIVYGDEITHIYMVDEKKEEIEQFLLQKYGYIPKSQKMKEVQELIDQYHDKGPVSQKICQRLQDSLNSNKIPKRYKETADVLKALQFLEQNDKKLYQREFSMIVFGSSKYMEENVRDELCRELRTVMDKPVSEEEMEDEILEEYHVYKEPSKIYLKGPLVLDYGNCSVDLSGLSEGVEMSYEQLISAREIIIKSKRIITIENLTSFLRCSDSESVFFYLGGYANRFQIMVLKRFYLENPQIRYYHFGDIDAGGFIIHSSLCLKTGIPFELLNMSKYELQDYRYQSCLQPLTPNDITRLKTLASDERYKETVEYMIQNQVKLEQEIISLEMYK